MPGGQKTERQQIYCRITDAWWTEYGYLCCLGTQTQGHLSYHRLEWSPGN